MAITVQGYNQFTEIIADGTLDLDGDTFKIALVDSGYVFDADHTTYADISGDEIANGNGYTTGGETLANVTWTRSGSASTLDADNPVWTATGGNIPAAAGAVIYDDTAGDALICYVDFDGEFPTLEGGTFTYNINAAGIVTLDLAS